MINKWWFIMGMALVWSIFHWAYAVPEEWREDMARLRIEINRLDRGIDQLRSELNRKATPLPEYRLEP